MQCSCGCSCTSTSCLELKQLGQDGVVGAPAGRGLTGRAGQVGGSGAQGALGGCCRRFWVGRGLADAQRGPPGGCSRVAAAEVLQGVGDGRSAIAHQEGRGGRGPARERDGVMGRVPGERDSG